MKVFLNGKVLTEEEAVISVFDHGFLYGYGLFETLRSYSGRIFLFQDHYERLRIAAQDYQIHMNKTLLQLQNDIYQTMEANGLQDAYIRITLSGGPEGLGLHGEEHHSPTWLIMTKPLGSWPAAKSLVSLNIKRSTPEGTRRAKSMSFANNMLAKKELVQRKEGSAEGIFFNNQGFIVEGTVSNIFFVKNNCLYTPHVETGLLAGVTRQFIFRLAKENQIPYEEGFYTIEDLLEADEIFITNSIQQIIPVKEVDHQPVSLVMGPLTSFFMQKYEQEVDKLGADT
ncbi:aminotransferase class IV [Ammoniphilus sp. CFH 90114]|uniref:aminotransferase class IV n=1 Tax=Ammoniphilus sp. CFH 90114 TaxID=2493665 RepID=UPI00100F4F93|nr:aminotransferase class IV [Ammoniphilus sp. CFH 90114]RXT09028.1 4-amino-4-deoxychorismate lyase [Ammoniphilus sp. CFH 90114]